MGLKETDWDENTPLTAATQSHAPKEVVKRILNAKLEVAERKVQNKRPLHIAIEQRQNNADVIRMLIEAFPDAAEEIMESGMRCLHFACAENAKEDVVAVLLEK